MDIFVNSRQSELVDTPRNIDLLWLTQKIDNDMLFIYF